jgi:hypothetical protein
MCRLRDVGDVVMPDFMVSDRSMGDIEARFRRILQGLRGREFVGGDVVCLMRRRTPRTGSQR